jgi:hypothetical protein
MAGITLSFRRLKSWRNELGGAVKGSAPIIAARAIARSRVFQKGRPSFHVVSDVQSLDHRVEWGGCRPDSSPAFRRKATPRCEEHIAQEPSTPPSLCPGAKTAHQQ